MIKKLTTITALILIIMLSFGCIEPAHAASAKKPKAPKITAASADGATVIISWKKAKNAKKYQIAERSANKVWIKYKSVKKSKKNKKKYTKANKYRVVAKGRKYIVYKYAYKYSVIRSLKKTAAKVSRINGEGLKSNTDYYFAVRSVNGKKHSTWKTVAVRTGAYYEWITVNGQSFKVTEKEAISLPLPSVPGAAVNKSSFEIIPQRDDVYDSFVGEEGDIRIQGKDPAGYDAFYSYDPPIDGGGRFYCGREKYTTWDERERYGYLSYGSLHMGWPTEFNINIYDENMKAVWTLDGTEPQYDQEPKYIPPSEYPFGTWTRSDNVLIHGVTTSTTGISEVRWANSSGYYAPRCAPIAVWVKLYYKDTLVEERILVEQS